MTFSKGLGYFSVVLVISMMGASQGFSAECGSDSSYLQVRNASGGFSPTSFSITFLGVTPETVNGQNLYRWSYGISFAGSNSEYDIAVPACNNGCEEGVVYSGASSVSVNEPGVGDKNTNWLVGDFQARVIQMPANSSSGNSIFFYTSRESVPAATSMQVKSGKTLYYVKDILGPTCPLDTLVPTSTTQDITISGNSYTLIKNRFGCIKQVLQDGEPLPVVPLDLNDGTTPSSGLLLCSPSDGRGGCNECIITTMGGSPHYTYFTVNGVPYKSRPFCLSGETAQMSGSTITECVGGGHPH